jgi:GNAT superfamily N-acetyltransferase
VSVASSSLLASASGGPDLLDIDRRPLGSDSVGVRALRPDDQDLLMAIFEGLGPESRTHRFLAPRPVLTERDASIITRIDALDHIGVIALAGSPPSPIGAAHCVRTVNVTVGETAIEVVDEWQRRGVARLLIAELRILALRVGIERFEWYAFESNRAVAALAQDMHDCRCIHHRNGVMRWVAAID